MKKQLLNLGIILLLIPAFNAQDLGTIIIRNGNNSYPQFIISLNGVRIANEYARVSTYSFLDGRNYEVKLLQSGIEGAKTFAISSEPKYITKYVINKDNYGNYSMILESKSLMADLVVPDAGGMTTSVTTPTIAAPVQPTKASILNNGMTTHSDAPAQPLETSTSTSSTVVITNISATEFNERLAAIKREHFDKDRLGKAQQVFEDEKLNTSQVIQVVKAFSFDESKVGFAKWAYSHTLDKKNYYKVEDNFSFSRSKTELKEYIKKQPKDQ